MTHTPAQTAEQRAKALLSQLMSDGFWTVRETKLVASAITQAEDAAYERAAELALDGVMVDVLGTVDGPPTKVWHGPTGFDLANSIRSLKSQKETP